MASKTLFWDTVSQRDGFTKLDSQAGCPGCYINVQRCVGLSMVYLQLKDPLEVFVKRKEFLPGSRFLSRRHMT